nr:helix-turn-helix domain-containing protein [Ardenticatena sp.]
MSGRRLQIEWQEDAERLKRLYKEESELALRVRWHALWLLRCGYSVAKVVEVVGGHERSVRRWIAWYPSRKYADIGEVGDRGNRRH